MLTLLYENVIINQVVCAFSQLCHVIILIPDVPQC